MNEARNGEERDDGSKRVKNRECNLGKRAFGYGKLREYGRRVF